VCRQKRKATEPTAAKNDGYDQFVDYTDQFVDNFLRYAADVQLPAAIRTAPRRTLSSASASGSTHAKTINDENIISKTFSQIRKARPRPCSRPRRGESLSSGCDGPDHAE
jgi:hypothetical protein